MTTKIYILICPIDGKVKYVGKSNDPFRRAKDHMIDLRGMDFNKASWILRLKQQKMKPIVEVVDDVPLFDWKFWEGFWIDYFKSLGYTLFNTRRSGNGLTYATHQTFKKGNTPWNKRR